VVFWVVFFFYCFFSVGVVVWKCKELDCTFGGGREESLEGVGARGRKFVGGNNEWLGSDCGQKNAMV